MHAESRLERFVEAQEGLYASAAAELAAGRKRSHWMWFVFPQLRGLGASPMSHFYGISSLDEARDYLGHALLGRRLLECVGLVMRHPERTAFEIFGSPDDLKFRSCLTLFSLVAGEERPEFARALDCFYAGERDPATLRALGRAKP